MPPKKKDVTADGADGAENDSGMSVDEQKFLLDCLMCPSNGSFNVDTQAVADRRGQKNAKSITNRISILKKKYNLPIGAGSSKASDAAGPNQPAIPITPSKERVVKPKATKRGAKKAVKEQKEEEEEAAKQESEEEEEEEEEENKQDVEMDQDEEGEDQDEEPEDDKDQYQDEEA
ncbi:MAG: hypothetical protein M1818_002378 [Claussenomyces sp. TS43310]|nr:MAG: hypothetical protein M1818_002378 [Claussenomyces sp. TS43310]